MKVKACIISGLLIIFSVAPTLASNLDLHDQINKANLIKLAPAEILEENINKTLETPHFLEKTQLHTQLGGTSKYLEGIDLAIDLAIYDYAYNLYESNTISAQTVIKIEKQMFIAKPSLRKVILRCGKPNEGINELVVEKANDDLLLRYTAM